MFIDIAKPCWHVSTAKASRMVARTPSTPVFSGASGELKKLKLRVMARPQVKKRRLDSPNNTNTEAQTKCAPPLAETAGVMSLGKGNTKPT